MVVGVLDGPGVLFGRRLDGRMDASEEPVEVALWGPACVTRLSRKSRTNGKSASKKKRAADSWALVKCPKSIAEPAQDPDLGVEPADPDLRRAAGRPGLMPGDLLEENGRRLDDVRFRGSSRRARPARPASTSSFRASVVIMTVLRPRFVEEGRVRPGPGPRLEDVGDDGVDREADEDLDDDRPFVRRRQRKPSQIGRAEHGRQGNEILEQIEQVADEQGRRPRRRAG